MIEIKNLTKSYGKNTVLSNVNLKIDTGSIFGLVGINGAGKSTLLRLLAGVLDVDRIEGKAMGEVLIDRENIFENESKKREILFLPDDPYFSPLMTAVELMKLYKAFYDFDESIFEHYLNTFSLKKTAPLRSYSKGMKRQLFVCIAFAARVKYLFLDEVFDGLDPASRLIFRRGLIDWTTKSGGTAVVSSHSLRELEDILDSYAIIDGKHITSSGSLGDSLDCIYKFNIATTEPLSRDRLGFECLSFEANGRIATIIAQGDKQKILEQISALNPLLIDELKMDFEEFFIIQTSNRSADNNASSLSAREER